MGRMAPSLPLLCARHERPTVRQHQVPQPAVLLLALALDVSGPLVVLVVVDRHAVVGRLLALVASSDRADHRTLHPRVPARRGAGGERWPRDRAPIGGGTRTAV